MRTLLFTSALYAKADDGCITSRIGISAPARLYSETDDLNAWIVREHRKKKVDCVFVDEAQFLTKTQVWQLARVADRLDIPVLCYGLRTDFRGELFPGSAELLAIADNLREIRTICHCGRKATMVVRRTADGRAITSGDQIGIEKSMYLSLCRMHWEEETGHGSRSGPAKTKASPAQKKSVAKRKPRAVSSKASLRIAAAQAKRPPRTRR
jgi:thymidine kinase